MTMTSFHGVSGTLRVCLVYPRMYNDRKTHLFIYWASDNFKKGCYNLVCPGFIQTDKSITLGQSFNQTSTIDGWTIEMPLAIIQDPNSKNWWINIDEKPIGYYPASLFSSMRSANQVAWFGKTTNDLDTPSPPMGSGALPNGVLGHACFF
ncbi:carboxyl-terminal peptidase [Medicago truncatula]|uniref:Carboxyl-terminal peptidase n=1 Tax=Medicago truncatula TaxID=3880 RepID=A0A072TJA0_MEDTR|nr:carboxyl-terminal peptidase [Medicago truncatula]